MRLLCVIVFFVAVWFETACMGIVSPAEAAYMPLSECASISDNDSKKEIVSKSGNIVETQHIQRNIYIDPFDRFSRSKDGASNTLRPSIYFNGVSEVGFNLSVDSFNYGRSFPKVGDIVGEDRFKSVGTQMKLANSECKNIGTFKQDEGFFCNISGFMSGVSRFLGDSKGLFHFCGLSIGSTLSSSPPSPTVARYNFAV